MTLRSRQIISVSTLLHLSQHTVVSQLAHCCILVSTLLYLSQHIVVSQLAHCCISVSTLLYLSQHIVVSQLAHCCISVSTLLYISQHNVVSQLAHCCISVIVVCGIQGLPLPCCLGIFYKSLFYLSFERKSHIQMIGLLFNSIQFNSRQIQRTYWQKTSVLFLQSFNLNIN